MSNTYRKTVNELVKSREVAELKDDMMLERGLRIVIAEMHSTAEMFGGAPFWRTRAERETFGAFVKGTSVLASDDIYAEWDRVTDKAMSAAGF